MTFLYLARLAPGRRYTASRPGRFTRGMPSQLSGVGSRATAPFEAPSVTTTAAIASARFKPS